MAKKFFEAPVVKISNFQTKDVIAASDPISTDDMGGAGTGDGDKAKLRINPSAGTIKKSGLTW